MSEESERQFPPFEEKELQEAFRYLRLSAKHAHMMPAPRAIHVDWFLMRAIGDEVTKRRKPDSNLPMLVGDVVREFIPDTTPARRSLGEAYRDGIMKMFSRRAHLQRGTKRRSTRRPVQNPDDGSGQKRLI